MNENISQNINWFPGHMAKTRRLISENISFCDIVIELLDARIPNSSKNPEIDGLTSTRPTLTLLNKSSLSDPEATKKWIAEYRARGRYALAVDCITGDGLGRIPAACASILRDKIAGWSDKGMSGRKIRAMILGIPNVGKSSLVNRLCGTKKARVEDRPGVTLSKQWVSAGKDLDLLDMPGVLWPKFEDPETGKNLAFTGAIKDSILDTETLAGELCLRLLARYPDLFLTRYKLTAEATEGKGAWELLETVAKKRGFLVSGGEPDTERAANIVLDEFRGGKIGRITLESPECAQDNTENQDA
ncbi:MAG: ribosome biogenesis GTPase YlqF [Clostridia bacterium]|nr:ribosome biogenesis GTPase YlqF [Clostridia bacterium]